jgi:hypothetical protein
LPHCGKCGLDFRGSCNGSGPFVPARRALDDGDDSLRRATGGGGGTSAADGNSFAITANGRIFDHHFATIPAGGDATINCSHAATEWDAANFLIK